MTGEAGEDRREGRVPRPLHHLPAGRGRCSKSPVRRGPRADRRLADRPFASMTDFNPDVPDPRRETYASQMSKCALPGREVQCTGYTTAISTQQTYEIAIQSPA